MSDTSKVLVELRAAKADLLKKRNEIDKQVRILVDKISAVVATEKIAVELKKMSPAKLAALKKALEAGK